MQPADDLNHGVNRLVAEDLVKVLRNRADHALGHDETQRARQLHILARLHKFIHAEADRSETEQGDPHGFLSHKKRLLSRASVFERKTLAFF